MKTRITRIVPETTTTKVLTNVKINLLSDLPAKGACPIASASLIYMDGKKPSVENLYPTTPVFDEVFASKKFLECMDDLMDLIAPHAEEIPVKVSEAEAEVVTEETV